ncbi:MAG: pyridoxamine 5'-phosphate oxidase family protein [Clostridium sp.]|nr:pyridoxamine 5'-phosphate oxidase family protein [Clostridium sp.]
MFKEIRRKDRKIEISEAIDMLEICEYGVLSTVNENGYPYGVPLSYVYAND